MQTILTSPSVALLLSVVVFTLPFSGLLTSLGIHQTLCFYFLSHPSVKILGNLLLIRILGVESRDKEWESHLSFYTFDMPALLVEEMEINFMAVCDFTIIIFM